MPIEIELLDEFNVIIEIPLNSPPVKYEVDHHTNMIAVDRFLQTAMFYPANYGFIPDTLSEDKDPVDVVVISNYPVIPGALMKIRVVGVLLMEDDSGLDEKIIAVPTSKLDITFDKIKDLEDVDIMVRNRIKHFFEHYKNLEPGKWVKINGWGNKEEAKKIISLAFKRYNDLQN